MAPVRIWEGLGAMGGAEAGVPAAFGGPAAVLGAPAVGEAF